MKIYELVHHSFNKNNDEQNFVFTTHFTDKEEALTDFLTACNYELHEVEEIEEDLRSSACDAEELKNAKVKQYHYYAEDEKYNDVRDFVCGALNEDNIIAYFACYKNEYREDSASVRIILKEVELN